MRRASLLILTVPLVWSACAWGRQAAAGESDGQAVPGQMIAGQAFQEPPLNPPVKGFTVHGGRWAARQDELAAPGGAGPKLICDEPAFGVGEVGVEVFFPDRAAGNAGLIVKTSDCGVGADRFNGYEVALDPSGHVVVGRHRQNFESIRNVPCPVPVNQWIPLVVRMTEKTLRIDVAGKTVFEYEDREHPLTSGQVGLRTWQREARFRNLWIRTDGRTRPVPFAPAAGSDETSGLWRAARRGSATGELAIETKAPFAGTQSQRVGFLGGQGQIGVRNGGGGGAGMSLVAGKPYEGHLWVRSDKPAEVFVALEDGGAGQVLAEARLQVPGGDWRRTDFSLSPSAASRAGRFVVTLRSPGCVVLGEASLEPGPWAWPETLALDGLPPIAFITRHPLSSPNTISCDIWQSRPRRPGCSIRIVEPGRPGRPVRTIFDSPDGCIYDMNVSYDARTLFFSYRKEGEPYWHLWRIRTDGTGLKQLTDGPHYDISPVLLPDGDILFVSTRRGGYTVCQPGPASNLHRMTADGLSIRCVSMNTLSDFSPQMMPDGRVLFTRWEYIDRDLTFRQSLWTQNPDGTGYQLYFGNTIRDVGTFWQARPLPGYLDRVVTTLAPHHGWPHGAIGLIDLRYGLEGPRGKGFTWVTQEFPEIGDRAHEWSYRDPFPLTERTFLCSYGGGVNRSRIFLLDSNDRKRLISEDPVAGCYYPLPLRPVPVPPVIASRAQPPDARDGTFLLVDVYRGLEPTIARGRVKYLRVMEQVRKTEDLVNRAYDQSPVMSYGTYYAKRCWGTVAVLGDGSAHFRAPALREIYFQALDAQGRELQRMTSAAQVMPGEAVSCIGCHEPRGQGPTGGPVPLAARQPPMDLEKPPWGNDGIVDFPTVVQPVLDKYCVKCHGGANPDGGCDLTGDKTRLFSMAYDNLLGRSRSYRQHNMDTGEMLPAERAKGKPLVHFYWLLRTPTAVNQPLWTGSHASRLLEYIDTDHCERKIPLEDRQRIYLWIDADVPYYGTYAHSHPRSPGRRDRFTDPVTGREYAWFAQDFLGVYDRRCASCHGRFPQPNDHANIWDGRTAWINLSRPPLSPALTAHLAKEAGGRGIVKPQDGNPPPAFLTTSDTDYQTMLKAIDTGRQLMLAHPEADMEGFRFGREEP
ncbi:MAG TPA: family 16 glycoside hydrolase [Phycisphaerae bacterium]|nr:family 16 glycoside hydrolase [Phycisphaerae bacterium]